MKNLPVKDILQWDVNSWYPALVHWEKRTDWNSVNTALELGGREGGLSLWLALKQKKVVCSDLQNVKQTAETLHQKYEVSSFVSYEDIDATNIPYENHFDVIVFKSILGGIGSFNNYTLQQKTFQQIHKALKPGGKVLFAENLTASPFHKWLRKRFVNWGGSWRYISLSEMSDLLKDFSQVEFQATGVLATFGRNEKQRNFLARIDTFLLNKICPKNWRYIVYGSAKK